MTIAKDELLNVMKNAGDYAYNGGAHLVGINMEGPFISASKKGAQAEENILHCDYEYFCRLQKAADGEVSMVFDTLHAVTMTSTQGTEILIHIGLDTVTLKGEPFTPHVVAGDKVKQGDLLMEVDLDKIQAAGLNTITPVLICNTDTYGKIALQKKGEVTLEDAVLKLS